MAQYSTGLLNQFAPHMPELSECNIPSLEEFKTTSNTWIQLYVLNSTFVYQYPSPMHQLGIVFMRKAESAFHEFYYSRKLLNSYINTEILKNNNPNQQISQYFELLHRFEVLISSIYQAFMVMKKFLAIDYDLWKPGDGSALEKANILYNFIKHASSKINETTTEPGYIIWLTNSEICCKDGSISYIEISELLIELSENAKYYCITPQVLSEAQHQAQQQET